MTDSQSKAGKAEDEFGTCYAKKWQHTQRWIGHAIRIKGPIKDLQTMSL